MISMLAGQKMEQMKKDKDFEKVRELAIKMRKGL